MASTIAHDAHNIVVVGVDDGDMTRAVQRLAEMGGGLVVIDDRDVQAELPLPVAGLLSDAPPSGGRRGVARACVQAAEDLGCKIAAPFQILCFLAGLGEKVPHGVVVEPGLRSAAEDRWRAAYEKAGSGALDALHEADPELVEEDSAGLAAALRRVLDALPEGGRALAAGHSPTNEAAVFGLTGEIVEPISKGGGVLVVAEDGAARVESLG